MRGFFTSALEPVLIHFCSCLGGEVNYVWNLEKNLAALEETMKVLRARRGDVLTKVQRQECEGLQRLNEVDVWLTSVEDIQNQVYELLLTRRDELDRLCLCGLCTKNLRTSHSYRKRVFEMLKEVEDLESKGVFEVVAVPPTNTRAEEVEMPLPSKRTVEEWEQAVHTLASSAAEFPGMEDDVLPILKYSYDGLKSERAKSCFQYCALFPEDISVEKEKLVDYWICEGLIDEKQGLMKAKNEGYGIIGTLVQACLLSQEEESESHVRMHDVVREMALWISSDFGKDKERCIVKAGVGLRQVPTVENWSSVRRMSLMDNEIENISDSPTCPELATLLFQKNKILNISGEFFKSMPRLVVLDLSNNRLVNGFPVEISMLVSLRYLDLSGNTGIELLFAGLLELKKLIYLNLEETGVTSISGISNLPSLRTLRLRHSQTWRDINVMEELQLLEHLEMVTIGMGSILVVGQLVNAYRAVNAIQVISIRFLEEKSILTLPDMPVLSMLDIYQSKMVEINIKRRSSSLSKSPTTPSFPDLSTVTLRDCHGLN